MDPFRAEKNQELTRVFPSSARNSISTLGWGSFNVNLAYHPPTQPKPWLKKQQGPYWKQSSLCFFWSVYLLIFVIQLLTSFFDRDYYKISKLSFSHSFLVISVMFIFLSINQLCWMSCKKLPQYFCCCHCILVVEWIHMSIFTCALHNLENRIKEKLLVVG